MLQRQIIVKASDIQIDIEDRKFIKYAIIGFDSIV